MIPIPLVRLVVAGLFAVALSSSTAAQSTVGVRITGLTSAERDSVTRALPGDLEVVFACVPAGILVIRSQQPATDRSDLRAQALLLLTPVVGESRIQQGTLTLPQAEKACEKARDE